MVAEAKPRVLIADDSAVTRYGIRAALERAGVEVCAEAVDGDAAVQRALEERPDVCLLDVNMPKGGGIRAAREIHRSLPGTAVLMLTASEAGEDVSAAMREGAAGYVLKNADLDQLVEAIRAVAAGEAVYSKQAVRKLLKEEDLRKRRAVLAEGRGALLSDREWEILELLDREDSIEGVALRLGVDEATVRDELAEAVSKLGVPDRHNAVALVRRLRSPD